MIGTIAGDTIGSAYEFSNTKDYNFRLFTSESDFTDDSIMTAAAVFLAALSLPLMVFPMSRAPFT